MRLLSESVSDNIRKEYIACFVNSDCEYYINKIHKLTRFNDGMCYTGYLWDCLKNKFIMSEEQCLENIRVHDKFYIFWDIHSKERIFIPNYWKYPKTAVIQMDYQEFIESRDTFPEDIYVVDKTFLWSVVFTHEVDENQERFCYYVYR